jgi:hypothetical protein
MYSLRYSFDDPTSGRTITPKFLSDIGVVTGTASYSHAFEINGWYAFNITMSDNQTGYLGFYDGATLLALFAINPQEAENMDAKISLLNPVGPGGVSYTYHAFNTLNNFPIVDAEVWASTDLDGLNVIGGTLITDSEGNALFQLPAGVYYFWIRHSRYKFNNPERIVIS